MLKSSSKIRVRYAETDAMKYVYYGNYAIYFEVARVELLRVYGMSYRELEDLGVRMPVRDFHVEYKLPAMYDDELTIEVEVKSLPESRMVFDYVTRRGDQVLNTASTTLVFVSALSGRPMRCPDALMNVIAPFFNQV
jgi:acyl-CoA thioester hydrolase